MIGALNSEVKGMSVLQSEVTPLKISLSAERSMIFVVVPSFSAIFLCGFCFFDGDLSVVEGYGVDLVSLLFCPVGYCGGVWSTAKNDYAFFFCFIIFFSYLLFRYGSVSHSGTIFGIYQIFLSNLNIGHPMSTLAMMFPMAT